MMNEAIVEIKFKEGEEEKTGQIILMRPSAGTRNDALEASETASGYSNVRFFRILLPACVKSHPFGKGSIKQQIEALDPAEYDKVVDVFRKIVGVDTKEIEKKSEQP